MSEGPTTGELRTRILDATCPHGRVKPAPNVEPFLFAGGVRWCPCCKNARGVFAPPIGEVLCDTCEVGK